MKDDPVCSPLCGASEAYGRFDAPWKHEPECPVRLAHEKARGEIGVNPLQRDIDHWNRTGRCLRHFSIDDPPRFCEQCGKDWKLVVDGREGRFYRRLRAERRRFAAALADA